ncbi:MAG: transposase [Gammaproteobacteria bacterium RIFOXYA12_FULL_61_12]|nr:MAG: transposase [Gammaproteobacteria bacterium RIFOXYD12_FULL_61_37]OGT93812.1 MAG: transposase [Gammaproteobacteria bacterium RIFOXYA12_FULL_61_12]
MSMNRIQFQPGLSLPAFLEQFGTEAQCEAALEKARWPQGFRCPHCGEAHHSLFRVGARKIFQCRACRTQTSLIAGTLFQHSHLAPTLWFLAIYRISQAKTGLSALALKRELGVSYPTAWLLQHKLMQAMVERDARYPLLGEVQVDDAYLGGERSGGKAGRGSENKVPFVAAVGLDAEGHPRYVKMALVPAFTRQAIADWAKVDLSPGCRVISDGLACFTGVLDAGCQHQPIIVGARKPRELPEFSWINTLLGNLKTSFGGAYHAFDFAKYGSRYLGAFAYRFNRRFHLETLPMRLLAAAASSGPHPEQWLRQAEVSC